MTVYEYRPEKNNTRIFGIMMIMLSLGAAFFFTPIIAPAVPFHWLFQLLGVVAIIAVIYLLTRYVAKSFVYAVIEDDGQLDFTVTELTNGGRKAITVCRVAISNITELHVFDLCDGEQKLREKEIWAEAHRDSRKCYDYCHDIKTTPVCLIALDECGEPIMIKIAAEDRLCSLLGGEK